MIAGVASLFRDSVLAAENAIVANRAQQALQAVRAGMAMYSTHLVANIHRGMKVAFANAIAHMLERALWIVALAVLVVLFIPELPLRSKPHADSAAAVE